MNEKDTINRLKAENREYIAILKALLLGLDNTTDQSQIRKLVDTANKELMDVAGKSLEAKEVDNSLAALLDYEFKEAINAKLALHGMLNTDYLDQHEKAANNWLVRNLVHDTSLKLNPYELDVLKVRFKAPACLLTPYPVAWYGKNEATEFTKYQSLKPICGLELKHKRARKRVNAMTENEKAALAESIRKAPEWLEKENQEYRI